MSDGSWCRVGRLVSSSLRIAASTWTSRSTWSSPRRSRGPAPSGPGLARRTRGGRGRMSGDRGGRGQPQRRPRARPPARRRGGRRGCRRRQVPDVRAGAAGLGRRHPPPSTSAPRASPLTASGRCSTRLALADDAWPELREHAEQRGLIFLSSPFDEAVRRPARARRRPRLQGRLGRADEPPVPRPPRPHRATAARVDGHGDHVRGRGGARRHRTERRRAGGAVPLRLELPGATRGRQPAGDRDHAGRLRRPRRLVVPHRPASSSASRLRPAVRTWSRST